MSDTELPRILGYCKDCRYYEKHVLDCGECCHPGALDGLSTPTLMVEDYDWCWHWERES